MPFYLKKERKVGDEWRIVAVCDNPSCSSHDGPERTVRRTWARAKYRESGTGYLCRSCSSSKNIQHAIAARGVNQNLKDTFSWLCEEILLRKIEDKTVNHIERVVGHLGEPYLVESARDFVALFINGDVPDRVLDLATMIEGKDDHALQLILDTVSFEDEMKAKALLRLENIAG